MRQDGVVICVVGCDIVPNSVFGESALKPHSSSRAMDGQRSRGLFICDVSGQLGWVT